MAHIHTLIHPQSWQSFTSTRTCTMGSYSLFCICLLRQAPLISDAITAVHLNLAATKLRMGNEAKVRIASLTLPRPLPRPTTVELCKSLLLQQLPHRLTIPTLRLTTYPSALPTLRL